MGWLPHGPVAVFLALILGPIAQAGAEDAVILLYHRISDQGPGSTRVAPQRFAAHLQQIKAGGYEVLPLGELLESTYEGHDIPERAVAITFDDAYRSVGEVAYPMLREHGLPFTVFVATDVVDARAGRFLSWERMREMAGSGLVTFGPHSRSHAHLESLGRRGIQGSLQERAEEIDGSLARLRAELGDAVLMAFAYPYGEYSRATESLLEARGLYGLAQQSGALGRATSRTRIPRFPLYVGGDSDERLRTALEARTLSMDEGASSDVFLAADARPPTRFRATPGPGAYRRADLSCFAATGKRLAQRWDGPVLEVSLPTLKPGRNKINCTAPAKDGSAYYWFSRLWVREDPQGLWLAR